MFECKLLCMCGKKDIFILECDSYGFIMLDLMAAASPKLTVPRRIEGINIY